MKQIEQQNKRVSPSPQKGAITERGLFRLMLPSLLGILLCSTCLAGLTWAYFSDSVTSSANTITAATFTVEVTITEITEAETGGEGSSTDPVGADSDVPATNGNSVNEVGGQEENTPSGTSSVNASNTAANAEGNTLTANVLSVGTTDPSIYTQTNAEGTPGGGSDPENKAAGEGTTTGEGSTSAEGTPEAGSVPKNEAAGEGTLAAANSPNTESKTDPPTPTPNTTTTVERNDDGSYTLTAGKKYTVTLTASGTATGYCKVTVNGNDYYTEKMGPEQELGFSIDCSSMTSETTVTITPGWVNSDYPNIEGEAATNKIDSGSTIGTPTTDDNATEQADLPAVAEPSADTDETLRGEIVQSNKQTSAEPTPAEPTPAEPTPVEPTPVEPTPVEPTPVEPTPAEPTPNGETPSEEPPATDEPTDTPSEGQSEE